MGGWTSDTWYIVFYFELYFKTFIVINSVVHSTHIVVFMGSVQADYAHLFKPLQVAESTCVVVLMGGSTSGPFPYFLLYWFCILKTKSHCPVCL